jgi:hypothetical protein
MATIQKRTVFRTPEKFGDGWSTQLGRLLAEEWLDENDGATVSFCTNTMLARGTIFMCEIRNRRAIAVSKQTWWAMSFSTPEVMEDVDLGEVRPIQYNGMMFVTLGVFNNEGRKPFLKVGRG